MRFMGFVSSILHRKKKEEGFPETGSMSSHIPELPRPEPRSEFRKTDFETSNPFTRPDMRMPSPQPMAIVSGEMENFRAKIDLMSTQIESMKIQYESMNERIIMIEKMVKELLDMAKS